MIYFTADTHFCHSNIINLNKRPFANIDAMNRALIVNNPMAKARGLKKSFID